MGGGRWWKEGGGWRLFHSWLTTLKSGTSVIEGGRIRQTKGRYYYHRMRGKCTWVLDRLPLSIDCNLLPSFRGISFSMGLW
jgi:hypothetical protein